MKNRNFMVNSLYNFLSGYNRSNRLKFHASLIKKAQARLRIAFFAWEAVKERILTSDNLVRRGVRTVRCFLCKSCLETCNHLLYFGAPTHIISGQWFFSCWAFLGSWMVMYLTKFLPGRVSQQENTS